MLCGRGRSAGAGRAMPGCTEEPRPPAGPAEVRRFLPHPPSAGGCPKVNKRMAEPRHRGCPSPGVPPLPPLSPGQFGGFSALPKPPAAAPTAALPCPLWLPPVSPPAPLTLLPPQAAAPSPSSGAKSPPQAQSRVCPQLPPPPRGTPGRMQVPLPAPRLFPVAPWAPWPHNPHDPHGPTTPMAPHSAGGDITHRQNLRDRASRPALLGDGGGFHQLPLLPGEHGSRGAEPLPSVAPGSVWPWGLGCRSPHRAGHIRRGELSGGRV